MQVQTKLSSRLVNTGGAGRPLVKIPAIVKDFPLL